MNRGIDMNAHRVCSEPNIWVFDDLLSEELLRHVDTAFESLKVHECRAREHGKARNSRSIQLPVDHVAQEIVDVIRTLGSVREVEPCRKLCISDVWGDTQHPHLDHINIDDIQRTYQQLGFLDLNKQSASVKNARKIVPTFSFVVYFNNVGAIKFPNAKLEDATIPGKRGRVIMFQNYIDMERPAHNKEATHYGLYLDDDSLPKRLMSMGILANETPNVLAKSTECSHSIDGLIYCPGVNDDGIRHDWYMPHHDSAPSAPAAPPPKEDVILIVEADFDSLAMVVNVRTVSGEDITSKLAEPTKDLGWLRSTVNEAVNKDGKYNLELMLPDGTILAKSDDDWILEMIFGLPPPAEANASEEPAPPLVREKSEYSKARPHVSELLGLSGPSDTVRIIFERWDSDGNGFITKEELVSALLEVDPTYTKEDLSEAFDMADLNKDGKIYWEEFLQWIFGVEMPSEVWKIKRPQVETVLKHQFPAASLSLVQSTLDRCDSDGYRAAALLKRAQSY